MVSSNWGDLRISKGLCHAHTRASVYNLHASAHTNGPPTKAREQRICPFVPRGRLSVTYPPGGPLHNSCVILPHETLGTCAAYCGLCWSFLLISCHSLGSSLSPVPCMQGDRRTSEEAPSLMSQVRGIPSVWMEWTPESGTGCRSTKKGSTYFVLNVPRHLSSSDEPSSQ